jgi:hypothetical protein
MSARHHSWRAPAAGMSGSGRPRHAHPATGMRALVAAAGDDSPATVTDGIGGANMRREISALRPPWCNVLASPRSVSSGHSSMRARRSMEGPDGRCSSRWIACPASCRQFSSPVPLRSGPVSSAPAQASGGGPGYPTGTVSVAFLSGTSAIIPSEVLRTARIPGISMVMPHVAPSISAAPASTRVSPMCEASGPTTT